MSKIKLKPCPCCDGHSVLDREDIFCQDCGLSLDIDQYIQRGEAETYQEAREMAIEVWNTRKPMERIVRSLQQRKDKAEKDYQETLDRGIMSPVLYDQSDLDSVELQTIIEAIQIVKEEGGV